MKVKVLLVPLTIVLSIALCIWLIYPLFVLVMDVRGDINVQKAKNSDLEDKIGKAQKLVVDLAANSSKQEKLMKFLPAEQKAEEIIDNLNYLAAQEGLSIFSLSVSRPKNLLKNNTNTIISSTSSSVGQLSASDQPAGEVDPNSRATDFEVEYGVVGNYSGIKNLLEKIHNFERFSRIDSLKIEKAILTDLTKAETTDSLKMKIFLTFDFLGKLKSVSSLDSKALSSEKFDMAIVDKIEESKRTKILTLEVNASGKANPFIP